jgi:hypothetical protein
VFAVSADVKLSTRNALRVLRRGPFRRYIIGSSISDTGTWMQVMAQGYVMSTLTNKALMLGMANLAAGLPMLLLTMAGGSAADRFDKRKFFSRLSMSRSRSPFPLGFDHERQTRDLAHSRVCGRTRHFEFI